MKLEDYLEKNNMSLRSFAKKIQYTPNYISAIIKGREVAGMKLIKAIEKCTDSQVTVKDILPPDHIYFC